METTALMPASRSEAVRVGLPDLRFRGGSFRRRAERTQRRERSKQVKGAKQAGQISSQPSRASDSPFALDPFQAASESKCEGDGRRRSQGEENGPKKTTLLSLAAMSLLMAWRSVSTCLSVSADLARAPVKAAVAYLPDKLWSWTGGCSRRRTRGLRVSARASERHTRRPPVTTDAQPPTDRARRGLRTTILGAVANRTADLNIF